MTRAEQQQRSIRDVANEIGSGLMPDNDQWVNRFTIPSTSEPGKFYVVAQRRGDHSWGCSCWAWRKSRRCKHLNHILQRLSELRGQYEAPILEMLASARTAYLLDLDVKPLRINAKIKPRLLDV